MSHTTNSPTESLIDRLKREAIAAGITLVKPNSSANGKHLYRLDCGCLKELMPSTVLYRNFRCVTHGKKKYRDEAKVRGLELIGAGTTQTSYTYRLPCGCEKVLSIVNVRSGNFFCETHDRFDESGEQSVVSDASPTPVEPTIVRSEDDRLIITILKAMNRQMTLDIDSLKQLLEVNQAEKRAMGDELARLRSSLREVETRPVEVFPSGDLTELAKRCFEQDVAGGEKVPFVEVCDMFDVPRSVVRNALVAAGFFSSPQRIGLRGITNGFTRADFDGEWLEAVNLKAIAIMDSVVTAYLKKQERKAA